MKGSIRSIKPNTHHLLQSIVLSVIFRLGRWGTSCEFLKRKWFGRYALRARIDDGSLKEAIKRAERGLVDADLGGNIIKLRIARKGEGRSSGYRTVVAYKKGKKAVFLYGFAKNERENIDDAELTTFKEMAVAWFKANEQEISRSLSNGLLQEVSYG